jgi:hypothetical protein
VGRGRSDFDFSIMTPELIMTWDHFPAFWSVITRQDLSGFLLVSPVSPTRWRFSRNSGTIGKIRLMADVGVPWTCLFYSKLLEPFPESDPAYTKVFGSQGTIAFIEDQC